MEDSTFDLALRWLYKHQSPLNFVQEDVIVISYPRGDGVGMGLLLESVDWYLEYYLIF